MGDEELVGSRPDVKLNDITSLVFLGICRCPSYRNKMCDSFDSGLHPSSESVDTFSGRVRGRTHTEEEKGVTPLQTGTDT